MAKLEFLPLISVIIPYRTTEKCDKVINSLRKVNYDFSKIEVIMVEGNQPSVQRNRAVEKAKGEIIYFLDNDSEVEEDIFIKVVEYYKNPEIVAVGGPAMVKDEAPLVSIISNMALSSLFGGCTVRSKYFPYGKVRLVDDKCLILCNTSIRRKVFLEEKGFNENLYPGEENEFFRRLYKKGYLLVYDPNIKVYRDWRITLGGYITAIFVYGKAKIEQGFHYYRWNDYLFFVPFLFFCYLLTLPLFTNKVWYYILYFYFFLLFFFVIESIIRRKKIVGVFLLLFFPLLHISFALGIIWGIIEKLFFRKKLKDIKFNIYSTDLKNM